MPKCLNQHVQCNSDCQSHAPVSSPGLVQQHSENPELNFHI